MKFEVLFVSVIVGVSLLARAFCLPTEQHLTLRYRELTPTWIASGYSVSVSLLISAPGSRFEAV